MNRKQIRNSKAIVKVTEETAPTAFTTEAEFADVTDAGDFDETSDTEHDLQSEAVTRTLGDLDSELEITVDPAPAAPVASPLSNLTADEALDLAEAMFPSEPEFPEPSDEDLEHMAVARATAGTVPPPAALKPKVTWLQHRLPQVNSSEYRVFRKEQGVTHVEYTAHAAGMMLPKGSVRNDVIKHLLSTYDTDAVANLPINNRDRQVLQYLGQLTEQGWSSLVNKILLKVQMRAD